MNEHYEKFEDDSPRGEQYLDDRTELAYIYDGESLVAILYDESEVQHFQYDTTYTVNLTPAGEIRCSETNSASEGSE